MIRKLGGIVAGIAVALLIVMIVEAIGFRLFAGGLGPDGGTPPNELALPVGVRLFVLAGWFLGPLAGGIAAVRISRFGWTAWGVALVLLLSILLRFALAPHPLWMMAAGAIAPLAGAALAAVVTRRRKA